MKKGIDVSQWQGTIDWQQVHPNVDFVFLKATEGPGFVDPSFQRNRAECNRLGIPWGPYHFAQIGSDPNSQAAHLWRTAGPSPLPPVLDLEPTSVPSRDACADWALTFQATLERAAGRIPTLYTGAYVQFTRRPSFTRYPLWLAAYTPQPIDCPPWPTWSVWQYGSTGRVPGIAGNVDMNQGKDDWLAAALGGTPAPPASAPAPEPTAPPEEEPMYEIVKFADKANLWLHGYDRQGEFFWPIPSPDDVDRHLVQKARTLAAGDDDLDARFHRITGL